MRVTRAQIERYFKLEAKRKELQRQASDLGKQVEEIENELIEYVEQNGGEARSVTTCGHVLAIVQKAGTVQWKPEFIRVAGQRAADQIIAAAPPRDAFSITPISPVAA
ncbi:MAG: hypothetical protein SFX18_12240 [Pirellulales bacterium]|nr:hypothetical protein [Pirellulales bacterium]